MEVRNILTWVSHMDNLTALLYKTPKSVFKITDLSLIWQERRSDRLKSKISYYIKQGVLRRITRGIYIKNQEYDPTELAAAVYNPSYISFETVLASAGIIFQHYDTIFIASKWSRQLDYDQGKVSIVFRKIKRQLLSSPVGIDNTGLYSKATPERAFLDMIYLFKEPYFDNLHSINWDLCFEIAPVYEKKLLIKRLNQYYLRYK